MKNLMNWKAKWLLLAMLACTLLPIGCSSVKRVEYVTGRDYISLHKGQTYRAPRDITLATESVIQKKDQMILDLMRANKKLEAEIAFIQGR